MFTLESERLQLRLFQPDDLDAYQQNVYGDTDVMTYLPGGVPRPIERTRELMDYFIKHHEKYGYSIWAVLERETGAFVGHGGLIHIGESDVVELAYAFGKSQWGKGYATEAACTALQYGFEAAGLEQIIALAFPANLPSQRVMQKVGMHRQGLTDAYHNAELVLYTITKGEFAEGVP